MPARDMFLLLILVGCMSSITQAEPENENSNAIQPAKPLVITEAHHNQTVRVPIGKVIHVHLMGELPKTGWEARSVSGPVERFGAQKGELNVSQTPEFTPAKNARDQAIGTYLFRYVAKTKGMSKLQFVYVYPGGPTPTRRSATKLVREFKVNVEVTEP